MAVNTPSSPHSNLLLLMPRYRSPRTFVTFLFLTRNLTGYTHTCPSRPSLSDAWPSPLELANLNLVVVRRLALLPLRGALSPLGSTSRLHLSTHFFNGTPNPTRLPLEVPTLQLTSSFSSSGISASKTTGPALSRAPSLVIYCNSLAYVTRNCSCSSIMPCALISDRSPLTWPWCVYGHGSGFSVKLTSGRSDATSLTEGGG